MVSVFIRITKLGRGRFVISKSSVNELKRIAKLRKDQKLDRLISINGRRLTPKQRKDGRIEIPRLIGKGLGLRKGRRKIRIERVPKRRFTDEIVTIPKKFKFRNLCIQVPKDNIPIELVDRRALLNEIMSVINDGVRNNLARKFSFILRFRLVINLDTGEEDVFPTPRSPVFSRRMLFTRQGVRQVRAEYRDFIDEQMNKFDAKVLTESPGIDRFIITVEFIGYDVCFFMPIRD